MATDSEAPHPMDDPGREVLAALGRIEGRLERMEARLRRVEAAILAAERRRSPEPGTFAGVSDAHRAAEAEWARVEAAGRQALEEEHS
jgi:hypothetical protein